MASIPTLGVAGARRRTWTYSIPTWRKPASTIKSRMTTRSANENGDRTIGTNSLPMCRRTASAISLLNAGAALQTVKAKRPPFFEHALDLPQCGGLIGF